MGSESSAALQLRSSVRIDRMAWCPQDWNRLSQASKRAACLLSLFLWKPRNSNFCGCVFLCFFGKTRNSNLDSNQCQSSKTLNSCKANHRFHCKAACFQSPEATPNGPTPYRYTPPNPAELWVSHAVQNNNRFSFNGDLS